MGIEIGVDETAAGADSASAGGKRGVVDELDVGEGGPLGFERGELGEQSVALRGMQGEADVGGALACGLDGILVRTGKYRQELVQASGVQPTEVVDSIADVPAIVRQRSA